MDKMDKMRNRVTDFGALTALAFIFSYLESLIPIPIGIPGVKLGLANLVVVVVLFTLGTRQAAYVSFVRILLAGLTFGSLYSILYSLAGGILSFAGMALSKRFRWLSITGTSILGGVLHNIGQLLIAALVLRTPGIAWYLPVLLVAGTITGMVLGILATMIIPRIPKRLYEDKR